MSNPRILVAGHICLDIIPTFPGTSERTTIEPGQLYDVGPAIFSTGGVVSNTGLALHRLGVPTQLIGKVADDLFGQQILSILESIDPLLADGMAVSKEGSSSYSIVISPQGVDRSFIHCPGTNDTFAAADVDLDLVASAELLHFGYPPVMREIYQNNGEQLRTLFESVQKRGVTTSLDMCMPDPQAASGQIDWRNWLANVLPCTDLFLPSIEETAFMLRRRVDECGTEASWCDIADELLSLGAAVVVLKLGEDGLFLKTAGDLKRHRLGAEWVGTTVRQHCFPANVAGTTGAGDCTIAGFLAAYIDHLSPSECLRTAAAVGACSVEQADATSGVPSMDAVKKRLAADWGDR